MTPAHQFPTGVVLSAARRAALIEWAERGDRLIIEDDYDAELCRERVGALQGLAPDRVLYIGSASKRLTPGMRLGWMLPPSWLSWALISAKAIEDARLGGRRTARARRLHRPRRARAPPAAHATALRPAPRDAARRSRARAPGLASEPAGPTGCMLLVQLPDDVDEPGLLAAAARHGVGIEGLSLHSYTGDARPAWCSATGISPSLRSSAACDCSPARGRRTDQPLVIVVRHARRRPPVTPAARPGSRRSAGRGSARWRPQASRVLRWTSSSRRLRRARTGGPPPPGGGR